MKEIKDFLKVAGISIVKSYCQTHISFLKLRRKKIDNENNYKFLLLSQIVACEIYLVDY